MFCRTCIRQSHWARGDLGQLGELGGKIHFHGLPNEPRYRLQDLKLNNVESGIEQEMSPSKVFSIAGNSPVSTSWQQRSVKPHPIHCLKSLFFAVFFWEIMPIKPVKDRKRELRGLYLIKRNPFQSSKTHHTWMSLWVFEFALANEARKRSIKNIHILEAQTTQESLCPVSPSPDRG